MPHFYLTQTISNIKIKLPAITCPPLPIPILGTLPINCVSGKVSLGENCAITCPPGSKNDGISVAQCLQTGQWSTPNLNCITIKSYPRGQVKQGVIHIHGQVNLKDPVQSKSISSFSETVSHPSTSSPNMYHRIPSVLRPYIMCPRDTTIILPKNQKTIYVRLEQPKSNVDFSTHVDVKPTWAKNLQAHLGAGIHTITFTAHSPNALSISEACVTVITVKSADEENSFVPQVNNCPKAIEVQLQPHEQYRSIFWIEPVFHSKHALKQIFKSNIPGSRFGAGHHKVTYIATDIHNRNSTCQFPVIVHPPGKS